MILASSSMSSHTIPLECCPRILPWNDIKITVDSQFVKSMFLKFGIPFADMHTSTYTSTFSSVQFSSFAQSCPTPCDSMDCSTPGLCVHHQLLKFTQTHVCWVGDAIQPSHPLSSPFSLTSNLSQGQGLFKWVNSSHQVDKVLEFQLQHQSFQWIFRTDLL